MRYINANKYKNKKMDHKRGRDTWKAPLPSRTPPFCGPHCGFDRKSLCLLQLKNYIGFIKENIYESLLIIIRPRTSHVVEQFFGLHTTMKIMQKHFNL